jgi:hypothetical protein
MSQHGTCTKGVYGGGIMNRLRCPSKNIRFIQPGFAVTNVRNFSQAICQQDFCSDDLEAKASPFVGQNLHETIQTLGISSSHMVSEVGKNCICSVKRWSKEYIVESGCADCGYWH